MDYELPNFPPKKKKKKNLFNSNYEHPKKKKKISNYENDIQNIVQTECASIITIHP